MKKYFYLLKICKNQGWRIQNSVSEHSTVLSPESEKIEAKKADKVIHGAFYSHNSFHNEISWLFFRKNRKSPIFSSKMGLMAKIGKK